MLLFTNSNVNQTANMNATFIILMVYHVLGTKYWDFSELWDLTIVVIPLTFLVLLAALGSLEAEFLNKSYSKDAHLIYFVICELCKLFSES